MVRRAPYRGFTLVELLVVLSILAALTAVAFSFVRLPLRRARAETLLAQVEALDAEARMRSRSGEQVQLRLDLRRNSVELVALSGTLLRPAVKCGSGMKLAHTILQGKRSGTESVEVGFGRTGTSASYAVAIADGTGRTRWLVFLGLSGECIHREGDKLEIAELLAS